MDDPANTVHPDDLKATDMEYAGYAMAIYAKLAEENVLDPQQQIYSGPTALGMGTDYSSLY